MVGDVVFFALMTNDFWTASQSMPPHRIFRVVRSAAPIDSAAQMTQSFDDVISVASKLPLGDWALFLDMRKAPATNDKSIERALRDARFKISSQTKRYALLMKSAVGVMQASRLTLKDMEGHDMDIFRDEDKAISFLVSLENQT